jgi:phosphoglycerate dehydrogenase-like enzyme
VVDVILVNEPFERWWSFSADAAAARWASPALHLLRVPAGVRLADAGLPADTTRLLALTMDMDLGDDLAQLSAVTEVAFVQEPGAVLTDHLRGRGIEVYTPRSEGFWGQSVAEFALGLTIAALRRIPQTSTAMTTSLAPWSYLPDPGAGRAGTRSGQFGDDPRFVSGTIAGKRVRVLGMGNIGARYADFCASLGADVAGWARSAADPVFHRTHTRRVTRLQDLVRDADIFAPMLPLTPHTERFVTAELIDLLPRGALVVLVTRAQIIDMDAVRRRVLADEIALASDVFDPEPVPLDDPLLGRDNVVHTPHNAGRTIDANQAFADELLDQFRSGH